MKPVGKNHPILTDKETKKKVRKKARILTAERGREVSEDEVVDEALDDADFVEEDERILGDLFD